MNPRTPEKVIRAAVVQLNSSGSLSENLAIVEQHLRSAEEQGVELLLLPENFAQLPAHSKNTHVESSSGGRVQSFLSAMAEAHNMHIVAGSLPMQSEQYSRAHARCLVYDNHGKLLSSYDKIHLFDVDLSDGQRIRESDTYVSGDSARTSPNIEVVDTKVARLGLSICYDLRFPELYRLLSAQVAQLLCVPSAFTFETGRAHWQILLQARAIENQCYVLAAAQVGKHANGRVTWGHSMIIDPWGKVLASLASDPGLLVADVDLKQLNTIRNSFPALTHRRLKYD